MGAYIMSAAFDRHRFRFRYVLLFLAFFSVCIEAFDIVPVWEYAVSKFDAKGRHLYKEFILPLLLEYKVTSVC